MSLGLFLFSTLLVIFPIASYAGEASYGLVPGGYDCVVDRMAGIYPSIYIHMPSDTKPDLQAMLNETRIAGELKPDSGILKLEVEPHTAPESCSTESGYKHVCISGLRITLPPSLKVADGDEYSYVYSSNGILFQHPFMTILFLGSVDPYAPVRFYAASLQGPGANLIREGRCVKME